MNEPNYHNPAGINEEIIKESEMTFHKSKYIRFLTKEEFVVLGNPETPWELYCEFFEKINPEIWNPSLKLWQSVILPLKGGFLLNNNFTYRTMADINISDTIKRDVEIKNINKFSFVKSFGKLSEIHHERMMEKGFWDDRDGIIAAAYLQSRDLGEAAENVINTAALALVATEVSEVVEALRNGNPSDDKIPNHCGAAAEMADVILRIMDLSYGNGWNVAQALVDKMAMNDSREKLHGKKF